MRLRGEMLLLDYPSHARFASTRWAVVMMRVMAADGRREHGINLLA
jgi:hypothetical protein